MSVVRIATEFSDTPGGRFNSDGPYSGQAFRARFLEPAVDRGEPVTVVLDGVAGLPSSFLEEAFGGLFRRPDANAATILRLVKAEAQRPALKTYLGLIDRYMKEAAQRVPA